MVSLGPGVAFAYFMHWGEDKASTHPMNSPSLILVVLDFAYRHLSINTVSARTFQVIAVKLTIVANLLSSDLPC